MYLTNNSYGITYGQNFVPVCSERQLLMNETRQCLGSGLTDDNVWLAQQSLEFVQELADLASNCSAEDNLDDLVYQVWENRIYDGELQNNACTKQIWEKFEQNKTAFNMLKQFEGKRPNYHLEWKLEDLGNCTTSPLYCFSGQTVPPDPQILGLIKIELNTKMISVASKMWIAKTMLHELIHAYIFDLARKDSPNWVPTNPDDFPSLWNAYVENRPNFQHEFMANHYIAIMTSALQSIANDLNIQVSPSDINAMVWSGLQNTTKWNEKSPSEKATIKEKWIQQISANECN